MKFFRSKKITLNLQKKKEKINNENLSHKYQRISDCCMNGSERIGCITRFTCIIQKKLYMFYIIVHEAYADAMLNTLLEMLQLHRVII